MGQDLLRLTLSSFSQRTAHTNAVANTLHRNLTESSQRVNRVEGDEVKSGSGGRSGRLGVHRSSICVSHTLRLESLSDTAMSDSEMSRMSAEQDEVDSRVPMNEKWKR